MTSNVESLSEDPEIFPNFCRCKIHVYKLTECRMIDGKVFCAVDHYGNWSLVAAAAVADGNVDGGICDW